MLHQCKSVKAALAFCLFQLFSELCRPGRVQRMHHTEHIAGLLPAVLLYKQLNGLTIGIDRVIRLTERHIQIPQLAPAICPIRVGLQQLCLGSHRSFRVPFPVQFTGSEQLALIIICR